LGQEGTILAIYAEGKSWNKLTIFFRESCCADDFNRLNMDRIEIKDEVKVIGYPWI
jgi:hypothetical protein